MAPSGDSGPNAASQEDHFARVLRAESRGLGLQSVCGGPQRGTERDLSASLGNQEVRSMTEQGRACCV